jgi:hypothetical protein
MGGTKLGVDETRTDVATHRADRWTAEPRRSRNWWTVVAAVCVLAAYAAAAVAAASVRGSIALTDDAQVALVGASPSLGIAGVLLALVGTRRTTLRAFSWLVLALGALLVVVAVALLATVLLALNDLA